MADDFPAAQPEPDITLLLQTVRNGGAGAEQQLVEAVYAELRRLAASNLRGDRAGDTTGPTALVHEAWLRLGLPNAAFDDRRHFFGAAARAMRQALVDRHRQRNRQKRVHRVAVDAELDSLAASLPLPPIDLLALDEALTALELIDPRMVQIVQLRYFAGLSVEETANALAVSERTVKREWNVARAWLYQRLGRNADG
ncbi:MAG: sigma-70 family RNA polymerase sigma factor [Planctomycetes bacterium]|jgi:RNA polymerase sigma factor (TIGR02999 family)|nr:sigma-70 family RNA polymerase sigma factor [Planctomycetota bacterium]